ncbi:MAG: hypothetical protein IT427_16835 [Pirellulales bacterium]|nr:hypothetical protein [Pirellulales bacterium]
MHHSTRKIGLTILAVLTSNVVFQGSLNQAEAAAITSADFSFAYGSTVKSATLPTWTLTENPGSATTIGDFTFSPDPAGQVQSGTGPTFVGAVLSDGGGEDVDRVGSLSDPFATGGFLLPISASYNGPAPADAAATPNYRLMIEITNLSIWGATTVADASSLAWDETTSGHLQTSPSIGLNVANSVALLNAASTYTQLAWDPTDYDTSLGAINDSFTRTFDFLPGTGNDGRIGDGIQITGKVHLLYDAVPEPGACLLAVLSSIGAAALRYARRGKRIVTA